MDSNINYFEELSNLGININENLISKQASLYSILSTTDEIERLWVENSIDEKQYEKECSNLISKFKVLYPTLQHLVPSLPLFMRNAGKNAQLGINRCLEGVPATAGSQQDRKKREKLVVFELVHNFISVMDALKLELRGVDEVYPGLSQLKDCLVRSSEFLPKVDLGKALKWEEKLKAMRASDRLGEEDARQMLFDLETAYGVLHEQLKDEL